MTAEEFRSIQQDLPDELAGNYSRLGRLLGRTRSMVSAYANGRHEIPQVVALAMRLLKATNDEGNHVISQLTSQTHAET